MAVGQYRHIVTVSNPTGPPVPTDSGYSQSYVDASSPWHVSIDPASQRDLERVRGGTVQSAASHIVRGRYRADVTTQTRLLFGSRLLHVNGVANPEERNLETIAVCQEILA